MSGPFIYITRGQMPDDFEVKRKEWYRKKHGPDVLGFGLLSSRGFSGVDHPQNCNVYEVNDLGIFDTPEYMAYRKADTFIPTVMSSFTYHSKTFYKQEIVTDRDGRDIADVPTLSGGALSLLYFEKDDASAVTSWFRNAVASRLGSEAVRTFRLWDQTHQHPLEPRKESRWVATIEWFEKAGLGKEALADAATQLAGAQVVRSEIVDKWYGLLLEDGFTHRRDI
jgi:hypothetical protein